MVLNPKELATQSLWISKHDALAVKISSFQSLNVHYRKHPREIKFMHHMKN